MLRESVRNRGSTISGLKALRGSPIPITDNAYEPRLGMVPPSKLRNAPSSGTSHATTNDTQQPEADLTPSHNTASSSQPVRVITRVQEEDSGIRMGNDADEEVIFVPPVYTVS